MNRFTNWKLYFALSWYLLVLVVKHGNGQERPQITEQILPEVKRQGTTGYLNCSVMRQGTNKVYWIQKNTQTILTNDDKIAIDLSLNTVINGYPKYEVFKRLQNADTTIYMLVIHQLQDIDSGQYTCQILVRGGTGTVGDSQSQQTISKDGNLTVLVPPAILQSQTTQTLHVAEGAQVNLTCGATGIPSPNISWVRANGVPLPPPYNTFTHKGTALMITAVRPIDQGIFRCVADNNVRPPASYDSTLYIDFAPIALPVQTTYGQAQNKLFSLTIECSVTGYPQPDLQWYQVVKGGLNPINDDSKHVINILLSYSQTLTISEFWFQLVIINIQGNDYGTYVCVGSNQLGRSEASILVYETSDCQGPNCPAGARYPSVTMADATTLHNYWRSCLRITLLLYLLNWLFL